MFILGIVIINFPPFSMCHIGCFVKINKNILFKNIYYFEHLIV